MEYALANITMSPKKRKMAPRRLRTNPTARLHRRNRGEMRLAA